MHFAYVEWVDWCNHRCLLEPIESCTTCRVRAAVLSPTTGSGHGGLTHTTELSEHPGRFCAISSCAGGTWTRALCSTTLGMYDTRSAVLTGPTAAAAERKGRLLGASWSKLLLYRAGAETLPISVVL